jgi:hypothetical protein
MRAAARSVPALLEMCADDAATRRHGREPLLAGLVMLSTRLRLPEGVLAATGTAVTDRVTRLMQPRRALWWHPRSLTTVLIVMGTAAAPAFALTMCTLQS